MKARQLIALLTILQLFGAIDIAVAQDSSRVNCGLPLHHLVVTSVFGERIHPVTGLKQFHNGVDLRAHLDTVFAIMPGVVVQTGYDRLLGIYIKIAHTANLFSVYGHLSVPLVITGEIVTGNQPIARSGNTGITTGEHLHFSILYSGQYIDPLKFLSKIFNNTIINLTQDDTTNF